MRHVAFRQEKLICLHYRTFSNKVKKIVLKMNSIANYGSDDDYDDSPEEKQMDSHISSRPYRKPGTPKQDDANYDEVQMSLSEDSSDESRPARDHSRRHSRDREDYHRSDSRRYNDHDTSRSSPKSRDDRYRKEKNDRREERHVAKNDRDDDRSKYRDDNREDDRTRDRYRGEKEDERPRERRDERRGKSRDRYTRDDRYRDRKDRERRRSRSPRDRDRRRSRSPRGSRSPRRTDRSRSRSKERSGRSGYSKRYERANNKMERLDKMDLQKSMGEEKKDNKDRFFVPGITGRFREQIEKRKLLWQKKEPEAKPEAVPSAQGVAGPGGSRTTKVWEATTFAQDTDGKVANKFKRLMGIKNAAEGSNTAVDVLKKQEEMFSSMEQQYEVARTATHTMRDLETLPANPPRQFSNGSCIAREGPTFEKRTC